ncbi:H-NS histone family protein [Xanthomonas perforans]|uniref:H-NS histone family protein n=1 Tax=Xanthomonas perforans TaxID=442694 RepID=UPI000D68668E|nr:H-NS histone family protein [Xanthomonas perforans]MBZ2415060.1 H-NS histone family protein [Xanthomonas perforans]MBZ2423641.1 H-NS histone family protein [Xanthomonas perforans]MBZ2427933.1 H-NS histone family protein [Xanthomonas perforans]MBZ2457142.1 H-NS histone family protein [Xanthomonas perforans]MBZ2470042.1 H-NS histone family protein [Xanthomonas perforans]
MAKDQPDVLPANLDLTALSVSQLTLLQQEIDKQKANAKERERQAVKGQVIAVLEAAGFSVADLTVLFQLPARGPARSRAMYRHPSKSKFTLTGKGRKPNWVSEYLAGEGHSLDDLKIK